MYIWTSLVNNTNHSANDTHTTAVINIVNFMMMPVAAVTDTCSYR